jgi:hypothetical protein
VGLLGVNVILSALGCYLETLMQPLGATDYVRGVFKLNKQLQSVTVTVLCRMIAGLLARGKAAEAGCLHDPAFVRPEPI